jgi:hypothetical protein
MKKYLIILFLLIGGLYACGSHDGKSKISEVALPPPPSADKEIRREKFAYAPPAEKEVAIDEPVGNADVKQAIEAKPVDIEKKIIKEGDIRFETGNVAETRKHIINSLKHLGGYAEDDSETTDGSLGSKEYTLSIRILAKNFDAFLGTVSTTATKIDSRNIRIKDVTTQFIDTKARLDNKLQLEKRYLTAKPRRQNARPAGY